jgi:hypothetical protein
MRLKGIWVLFAIALTGMALAAAGCGGGGDSTTTVTVEEATDTATTVETTTEELTTTEEVTTTEEMETTTEETSTDETETEASGTTGLSFLTSAKCQEYVSLIQSYATALSGAGGTDMQNAADALQEVADQAPDEIKDDFATLADAYGKIAEALGDTDLSAGQTPSAEALAKLQELGNSIDSAKVAEASTNISDWLTKNCTGVGG